jgi:hypothetical protein
VGSVSRLATSGPYAALKVVRECSKVEGPPRAVLTVIATYADDRGVAWPSIPTIARDAGLSRSTVIRAIKLLVATGELLVVKRGGGQTTSTRYRIPLDLLVGASVDNPVESVDNDSENSVRVTLLPIENSVTGGREQCHPDTQRTIEEPRGDAGATEDTCPTHRGLDDPPPCRRCRDQRVAADAARALLAKTSADERRRVEQERLAAEAAEAAARRSPGPPEHFRRARGKG